MPILFNDVDNFVEDPLSNPYTFQQLILHGRSFRYQAKGAQV